MSLTWIVRYGIIKAVYKEMFVETDRLRRKV